MKALDGTSVNVVYDRIYIDVNILRTGTNV